MAFSSMNKPNVIDIDVLVEAGWDEKFDWQKLGGAAVLAALSVSAYAGLATSPAELAVRLTSDDAVQTLNRTWRGKDEATNVLSFPMADPDELDHVSGAPLMLGDIALASGVCAREAADKGISVADHATHLIVHGVLHLLGYDHIDAGDADEMESLERVALAKLGLADPYGEQDA
jgi:probable rRNA maturation factor